MADRVWNQAELARKADVDEGTVSDLLTGTRRPRRDTLAKIEQALGWDAGRATALRDGSAVGPVQDDADGVLLDLPDEALDGLDELQREEVKAAARLAALKTAREIRGR